MEEKLTLAGDVHRLQLQPGDSIVLTVDGYLTVDQAERLKRMLESRFPEHRCLVLERGMSLQVVRPPC